MIPATPFPEAPKKITPGQKVAVRMTSRDRQLLLDYTLGEPEYAERLKPVAGSGDLVGQYTLDELEDMLGYIAAQGSHTGNAKLRRELHALYERLSKVQQAYDDGGWQDSAL